MAKLLNLFSSDCSLASRFDIRQLMEEMDSIKAQNKEERDRMIEQKVQQVISDADSGNVNSPLPCQSEESKRMFSILSNYWKNKNSNQNAKKKFLSRKQNSKKWRKARKGSDYGDRLAAKALKSKRKKKQRNRI